MREPHVVASAAVMPQPDGAEQWGWRTGAALGVAAAIGLLLLSACVPVNPRTSRPALLPTPTATPYVDLATAPRPDFGVRFPDDPLIIQPVVMQPPTPLPPALLPAPTPTVEPLGDIVTVGIDASVPDDWAGHLLAVLTQTPRLSGPNGSAQLEVLDQPELARTQIALRPYPAAANPVVTRVLAAVAPFATIADDVTLDELAARWRDPATAGALIVSEEAAALLPALWGPRAEGVAVAPRDALLGLLESQPGAIAIMRFDQVDPRFKVLAVDGANPLDNRLELGDYPLTVALSVEGSGAAAIRALLKDTIKPAINRDPAEMTQLIMTGVTAMSRVTAVKMDRNGYDYPARVISDVLAAADITHISNEVPFLDDCVANPTENNLILCSDTDYWAALAAVGTDIVGLSGNHVNDFGRDGALRSLSWYHNNGIPIYGSGMNVDEACAPLLWEHNGNTFAFIAALAFDPPGAWATADLPGACYYYTNKDRLLELVRQLSQRVDIVAVELQHQETYEPYPIPLQVAEFRELRDAGADIVTGVMSHVPQAQEPYGRTDPGGAGIVSYGLGNLFFDQMWSWETRTELATRHTIYAGQLLNTEILTMVLEDYAQPRWATPEERADILGRIFAAAPRRE